MSPQSLERRWQKETSIEMEADGCMTRLPDPHEKNETTETEPTERSNPRLKKVDSPNAHFRQEPPTNNAASQLQRRTGNNSISHQTPPTTSYL